MTNINKIVFSVLLITSLISSFMVYGVQDVAAAAHDDKQVDINNGDQVKQQVRADYRIRFRFEKETKITFEANKPANVSIKCDAEDIGDKDFEIEVESDDAFNMTMNCKEQQYEKGLVNGNTVQVRNRIRHRYQEGFVVDIESSEDDIEAKLRIEETEENRGGTWAYYDKQDEEWVPVETKSENGYLECKTDHFSTWTILVPEIDFTLTLIVGIGIGAAVVLVGASFLIIRKRRK